MEPKYTIWIPLAAGGGQISSAIVAPISCALKSSYYAMKIFGSGNSLAFSTIWTFDPAIWPAYTDVFKVFFG
jgi:hypothetical protein